MSELQTSSNQAHRGGIRSKKLSTRVDLTPMVDLGFLLITFFIFTTTMSQPSVMKLILPDDTDTDHPTLAANSKTVSFILGDNNLIYYYQGTDLATMQTTDYSSSGIRNVLQKKMEELTARFGKRGELIALIKPTPDANYRNVVDMLDEMTINEVTRFMLLEADANEVKRVKFGIHY